MSFVRPSLSALIARIQADYDGALIGADSRLRRSFLGVIAKVKAGVVSGLYGAIDYHAHFFPDPDYPDTVLRWASILQVARKPAIAASGYVTLTGAEAVPVPAGTQFQRADGGRYASDADATIAGGTASVSVTAQDAGALANMEAGQQLTFLSPVAGVQAVAVVAAGGIAAGADEETIADLNSRVLARLGDPPSGGKAGDYIKWAKDVAEVTRAWVYANWDGLGTVKVLFVMDGRDDIIPQAGDVIAVSDYIETRRPVCADVTVAAPIADPLDFDIDLVPDTAGVRTAVDAELRDLIAREAEPGGTLLISHIREAISIAAGETDHVLNSPAANVTVAAGAITTMGAITW